MEDGDSDSGLHSTKTLSTSFNKINASSSKPTLFLREASGLVRAWSTYDAFVYATLSINLVTLGLYIFSFAVWWPNANLIPAIIISSFFMAFEVITYASLIAIMPRAGGDYVWQTRVFGGFIGFVLAVTGWVFILWHWVPIYGQILVYEVFTPILLLLGNITGSEALKSVALWFSTSDGLFASSMIVIVVVSFIISLGMRWYARIQKWLFHFALLGLAILMYLMITTPRETFVNSFNSFMYSLFGVQNAYQSVLASAAENGYTPLPFWALGAMASEALIPLVVFFNLWPNWGATLYGEVRGANDFKRNMKGLMGALVFTTILAIALLAAIASSIGWEFYHSANFVFWMYYYGYLEQAPMTIWPYPGLLGALLTNNTWLQLLILILMSCWFFAWSGTVFLSSTRVIFAAAFDRVLPAFLADVKTRFRTPIYSLAMMAIPSIIVSWLYCYTEFWRFTLDATVVIAITYLGSAIAAILLPYKRSDIYKLSPVSGYKVAGIPLMTFSGVIFAAFLIYLILRWAIDPLYGVNDPLSAIYMALLYIIAIVIYVVAKWYRKNKEGIDLSLIYREIPVE